MRDIAPTRWAVGMEEVVILLTELTAAACYCKLPTAQKLR